jgi:hypothetical protein
MFRDKINWIYDNAINVFMFGFGFLLMSFGAGFLFTVGVVGLFTAGLLGSSFIAKKLDKPAEPKQLYSSEDMEEVDRFLDE